MAGSRKQTGVEIEISTSTELPQGVQLKRPAPQAPSFGMCEGVRADLEQVDETTDPFTGKVVTAEDAK